jgi:putative endonuclease
MNIKNNPAEGFTKRYNVHNLVYYEVYDNIETAIAREKQIKNWRRVYKTNVINKLNPEWKDLYDDIM